MNYYLVKAKCGHVGAGKYIVKTFPVKAQTKTEASAKIKRCKKVKKHLKDLIISVEQVVFEVFNQQKEMNKYDIYLHSHTKREILDILCSEDVLYNQKRQKTYKSKYEFDCRKEKVGYHLKKTFYKESSYYEYAY